MKICLAAPLNRGAFGVSVLLKLQKMRHQVIPFDYRACIQDVGQAEMNKFFVQAQDKCDLTLVIKGESIDPATLKHPAAIWFTDDPARYPWADKLGEAYDVKYAVRPSNVFKYLPIGVDMDVHKPVAANPIHLVGFAGTGRPERTELIRHLWEKYQIQIYGNSWNPAAPYFKGKAIYNKDLNQFYSSLSFVFNVSSFGELNSRILETMSIGCSVLLTNYSKEVGSYFRHGQHLFFYNDIEELDEILSNIPTEAKLSAMRLRAREAVMNGHTIEKRLERIFKDIGEL